MNQNKSAITKPIEARFAAAATLFKNKEYSLAQTAFQELSREVQNNLNYSQHQSALKKILSECYLNKALCLLVLEEKDENQREAIKALDKCLEMNALNYWGYLNLFSLYYQGFNYISALQNIKCSLSCLYLIKAVLCKDVESKSREKDLGKAIGLCPNNLQAAFIRLIMHVNQKRWKNALNQLAIIEQMLGTNDCLTSLESDLHLIKNNQIEENIGREKIIRSIALLQKQVTQPRLTPSDEQGQDLVKVIHQKMYEFNEILSEVNQLGHVFGIFHYQSLTEHQHSHKKIQVMSNFISMEELKDELEESKTLHPEIKDEEMILPESNHEFKNNQSLFDYTKSNNQYIENSKKEGIFNSKKEEQISGNLLSSLQVTKKVHQGPILQQNQDPELTNSQAFNLESIFLANMRKKEFNIRSIESEIHPLDPQEEIFYNTLGSNHHNRFLNNEDDDDLLLDSAFDKSFAGKSNLVKKQSVISKKDSRLKKKESVEHLGESKRLKMEKSKTQERKRIYPLGQKYKYLELYLNDFEFKDSNQGQVTDIYAEFSIKTQLGKNQKFSSKRQNSKLVGLKQKVDWDDSLGYIQLPQQPVSLEVAIMKTERDKFYDACLGKGEIELIFTGINKFPIYSSSRQIGMAAAKLILSEEILTSSFKQSSLSSSHKTSSQNSVS